MNSIARLYLAEVRFPRPTWMLRRRERHLLAETLRDVARRVEQGVAGQGLTLIPRARALDERLREDDDMAERRFKVSVSVTVQDKATDEEFFASSANWADMGLEDVQGVEAAFLKLGETLLEQSFADTGGKPSFLTSAKK